MDEQVIKKMDLTSGDVVEDRIEQLKALFPEIAVEGVGSIDFEKLRLILGDEVDEGQERYAFTWPGKADAIRQAQTPSTATLRPDEDASVDWDDTENLYIEGDNLEVLKLLQRGYHGKVKMIYIDPPYNTGHDFVYKDSFQDSIENYREQAGLSGQSNADTRGRYHSDWLSMMYPRLRLARELLQHDGIICISIDENEDWNLQEVCNEVFGEVNLVAKIPTLCNPKGRSQDKYIATCHEYLLIYSKSELPSGSVSIPKTESELEKDYPLFDENKELYYRELELRNTHRDFGKFNRPNLYYPFYVDNNGCVYLSEVSNTVEVYPDWEDGFQGCWTWSRKKSLEESDYLSAKHVNGKWKIYRKSYAGEDGDFPLKQVKSIWIDKLFHTEKGQQAFNELFSTKDKIFQSPKSPYLIMQCIMMAQDKNCIVLDFFSGSATTAEAVIKLNCNDGGNRKFVLIQLPEALDSDSPATQMNFNTLCQIGEERIRRAGQKIKAEIKEENKQLKLGEDPKPVPDIGFRVLKLDSSNFDQVEGGVLVDSLVKPGRTHDDIIFEMMLKWGLELSLPMEKTEVAGYPVTSIAADELICCMDEGLTVEVLEAIAVLEPKRVFFLDSVLTDTIKLNAAQIFKRVGDKLGCEIELRTA